MNLADHKGTQMTDTIAHTDGFPFFSTRSLATDHVIGVLSATSISRFLLMHGKEPGCEATTSCNKIITTFVHQLYIILMALKVDVIV